MAKIFVGNANFEVELADPFVVWEYEQEMCQKRHSRIKATGDVGRIIQGLKLEMHDGKVIFHEMMVDKISLEGVLIPKFEGDRYEWFKYEAQDKVKEQKQETWRDREPLL